MSPTSHATWRTGAARQQHEIKHRRRVRAHKKCKNRVDLVGDMIKGMQITGGPRDRLLRPGVQATPAGQRGLVAGGEISPAGSSSSSAETHGW